MTEMTLTYEKISKAEEMFDCYDDAMACIREAIRTLRKATDPAATNIADALSDILQEVEEENAIYEEIVNESEKMERRQMEYDYRRAVS